MNIYVRFWKLRAQEINALLRDAISNQYPDFFFHVALFLSHCSNSSLIGIKTELSQSYLHCIHRLDQVYFLEKAEMPHPEDLPLQVLLSASKDHVILFAQCLEQGFRINAFGCEHGRNCIRGIFMISEQSQAHLFSPPAHVIAYPLVPFKD